MSNPIVTIEMENGDIIKAELYPEDRAEHRQQLYLPRQARGFTTD